MNNINKENMTIIDFEIGTDDVFLEELNTDSVPDTPDNDYLDTPNVKKYNDNEPKSYTKYETVWFSKQSKKQDSPMLKAQEEAIKKNHKFIVSCQVAKNRLYASYESAEKAIAIINKYKNIHMYELLQENQPLNLYFDIEFPANQIDVNKALISLVQYVKNIMVDTFGLGETFDDEDISLSGSIGMGKIENVEVLKASYHIVIQCNSSFKNMKDLKTFMNYFKYRIDEDKPENFFYTLNDNVKRIVDFQVYGKNQNMKLPYQSKHGSDRVQAPMDTNNLIRHLCGNYQNIQDFDIFDISKVPVYEPTQKTTVQKALVGGKNDYVSHGSIHTDFVARECIPDGEPTFDLKYIVESIDNTNQPYNVWFGIGCAIKNCKHKDGRDIFLKWSSKYSGYNQNDCLKVWDRIQVRDNGYNQGTLLLLAKKCNPKLQDKKKNHFK